MEHDEMIEALETDCTTSRHRAFQNMSVRPGEGWALHGLIRLLRPRTVVEIGRLEGISSEWILTAMDGNDKGHLDSIDLITRRECHPRIDKWVDSGRLTIHEFSSHGEESEALAETLGTVDFIFIDGDHTPDAVERDCRTWLPRVRGYAVFHDWAFEGVRVGIRRVVDFEKFPRYVMSKECKDDESDSGHGHGLMVLYLPDGLDSMPDEPIGREG
jgi:predicted O-methyltransferase YrrM